MARRNDKRVRLVEAADQLFQQQGVNVTTLANIAQLADVALGNVYYYFKSKDSIILAVIEYRRGKMRSLFNEIEQQADARTRLISLIRHNGKVAETSPENGDALGSFCQELSKQGGDLSQHAAILLQDVIGWIEKQFVALGKTESAADLAVYLMSGLQGMSLLNLTFKDAGILDRQVQQLSHWVESV